jgi:hypothetical protein
MKTVQYAARLRRYIRLVVSVVLSALLGLFVGASPTSVNAAALECPEIGHTGVPDLTGDPTRAKLQVGGSGIDLDNEISELINEVQLKQPGISNADLTKLPLIARWWRKRRGDQCAAVDPDASVYPASTAAARCKRSAAGINDHSRGAGAARSLSPVQEPG